jgi:hypothetical protein
MADVLKKIAQEVRQRLRGGIPQAGLISWFDPEWRVWAEETAAEIRILLEANGFQLTSKQREIAERILASGRGMAERWINLKFDSGTVVALWEKLAADIPDFMATVLFSNDEQFAAWLEARGGREAIRGLLLRRCKLLIERVKQKVLGAISDALSRVTAKGEQRADG